jgi:hypothetical protein
VFGELALAPEARKMIFAMQHVLPSAEARGGEK